MGSPDLQVLGSGLPRHSIVARFIQSPLSRNTRLVSPDLLVQGGVLRMLRMHVFPMKVGQMRRHLGDLFGDILGTGQWVASRLSPTPAGRACCAACQLLATFVQHGSCVCF